MCTPARSHLEILDTLPALLKRHTPRVIHEHNHVEERDLNEVRGELGGEAPRLGQLLERAGTVDPLGDLVEALRRVERLEVLLRRQRGAQAWSREGAGVERGPE